MPLAKLFKILILTIVWGQNLQGLDALIYVKEPDYNTPPPELKKINPRLFLGVGVGGEYKNIREKNLIDSSYDSSRSGFIAILKAFIGAELLFKNGNGFNIVGSIGTINSQADIGINYVYEHPGNTRWGIFSGFDIGTTYARNEYYLYSEPRYFVADYNIGARIKILHQVIFLQAKFPLFDRVDKGSFYIQKTYAPSLSINYAYFFEF